jgi:flagellin
MVIQHNISALNSYRNLTVNQNALSKNLEKLSSGYKINRAADDAAGLAISESMRSKINGLTQAEANANDAVGLIQTEEGALTETHSMLQRMTTLATQAANGTYSRKDEGQTARSSIQAEMDELAKEITRIATSTTYNGLSPLNNTSQVQLQIGPTSKEILNVTGMVMTASKLGVSGLNMKTVSGANSAITTIKSAIN